MKLNWFDKIILILNILAIGSLLAAYGASYVNPEQFWPLAFFGLGLPVIILFNIIFVVFWLLRRKWLFLLSLASIILGWAQVHKMFALNLGTDRPEGTKVIKLMSYNVRGFNRYGESDGLPKKENILKLIKSHAPDIITFQEFFTSTHKLHQNLERLQAIGYPYLHFERLFSYKNQAFWGIAVFSKFPILSSGRLEFPTRNTNNNGCVYADLLIDGQKLRIYNLHLQSINLSREEHAFAEQFREETINDVKSLGQITNKLRMAFVKRSRQALAIRDQIRESPFPLILTGDFNDTPHSFAYHQLSKGLKDVFLECGFGLGGTYAGPFPSFRIDFILTSPSIPAVKYHALEETFSDHYPLVYEFEVPQEQN